MATIEELKKLKPGDKITYMGCNATVVNKEEGCLHIDQASDLNLEEFDLFWKYDVVDVPPFFGVNGYNAGQLDKNTNWCESVTILETKTNIQLQEDIHYCSCTDPILVESFVKFDEKFMYCRKCKKESK